MATAVFDMKPDVEDPKTGIENKQKVAANIVACLADSYILMVKTQGYHWNVVGPLFQPIHELTEQHYNDLFKAIDELAERIRALGYPAPTSIAEMISLTRVQEDTENPTTEEMIQNLIRDHEIVARRFRNSVERAEDVRDVATADMLTQRIAFHEKAIWMLQALLAK